MLRFPTLTGAAALVVIVSGSAIAAESAFSVAKEAHGVLIKAPDGKPVFGYVTEKAKDSKLTANSVCCLHPVYTPSGEGLTGFAPDDHLHHRGVFMTWYAMRGAKDADFWGWGKFAPVKDRVIENRSVKLASADAKHAKVRIGNAWMVEGDVMIDEDLYITARRRAPAHVIDLTYTLTPTAEVRLGQTAFGGFCVRARKDGKFTVHGPEGEVTLKNPHYLKPATNWPVSDWYAYTLELPDGKTIGLAVIDHPKNPPSTWHNPRTVWMLNPCPTAAGPITFPKGKPFVLRYRLVAFDGPTPRQLLKELAAQLPR